jgi:hypothetical protein
MDRKTHIIICCLLDVLWLHNFGFIRSFSKFVCIRITNINTFLKSHLEKIRPKVRIKKLHGSGFRKPSSQTGATNRELQASPLPTTVQRRKIEGSDREVAIIPEPADCGMRGRF